MTVTTATIGYPRIGPRREQKTTVELFWKNKATATELLNTQHAVEAQAWTSQKNAGVELIGVDGTLYDQILDTVFLLGIIPKRFQHLSGLDQYFALARGAEGAQALDMSKFFDTNYHFMVPELEQGWSCQLNCTELLGKVSRCQSIVGKSAAVPIIIGPVTFAALARRQDPTETLQQCVDKLLPTYKALLSELTKLRVPEVQLHEPYLTTTKAIGLREVYTTAYSALASCGLPINLCTYYDDLSSAVYPWAVALPVAAVSLDFLGVPGAAEPNLTLQLLREHGFPTDKRLGAGVVDGRSVWADTGFAHVLVAELVSRGLNVCVQTSAPLQHLPLDVRMETTLSDDLKSRLGFAVQKLDELVAVARKAASVKAGSIILCDLAAWQPKDLAVPVAEELFHRSLPFEERRAQQVQYHAFPTTTIGSFPQTAEVRRLRLQHKQGKLSTEAYDRAMAAHIGYAVGIQEALGIDVLVHGEFERTDMVEYFGQHLEGMAFTEHAWVQSYGSRYVRPPLIVSDIKFTGPMTVREFQLAQSLTTRPMKGMLTGPITMLNWSFPRRDITRSAQAKQLALALRQEVAALQDAGCRVVQVDDPALREGLPLKDERWAAYLKWAVDAFRLTTAVAAPSMQVVTHLCYSDFADIMGAIDAMDADVLTIENSRSGDEMVKALAASGYSKDLGPGVYDVHSPVVPEVAFIREKLKSFAATGVLHGRLDRIHCNPDCGLKTRGWAETIPALKNMVQAAAEARAELGGCEKAETGKDSADKGAWKPAHRCC